MGERRRPSRPDDAGRRLETLFEGLREEWAAAPPAPGFLAGFRTRRDAWLERADHAAAWRLLALRLSPVGAIAAGAALAVTIASDARPAAPETVPEAPVNTEYPDPFVAGLEEAGASAVAMNDEDAGFELLAVLSEPMGPR